MSTLEHHRLPAPLAVIRHAVPNVLVSTIIPTALFYLGWYVAGRSAAFALALGWALTLVGWRSVRRQRIPALLTLTTVLLVLRTAIALMSGSTRLYFMQPIATTVVIGALFLISIASGRPLITRLAGDFCPLPAEVTERPDVQRHFRNLSFLWAGVYFSNATVTLLLLMNLPVTAFVATHTLSNLVIMWSGVALTARWSYSVARTIGLTGRPAPVVVAA